MTQRWDEVVPIYAAIRDNETARLSETRQKIHDLEVKINELQSRIIRS